LGIGSGLGRVQRDSTITATIALAPPEPDMSHSATPAAIAEGQFASLANGMRLHYASAGARGKPLIVFLHGFPEFCGAWDQILPIFAEHYFAVAPDLRGYNLSSQPPEVSAYRLRAVVQDLVELLGELGYEQAVFVGHDWGGSLAWRMASAHPERTERLVVINAPHPNAFARELSRNPAQQVASRHVNWLRTAEMEQALSADDFARLRDWMRAMPRAGHAWLTPERMQRYVTVWRRGLTGPLNYYRASPLHPASESSEATSRLRLNEEQFFVAMPTLLLWGMRDESLVPELLDDLQQWVPDLRVERFAAATHWIVHEEPARVAGRIFAFLERPAPGVAGAGAAGPRGPDNLGEPK
jgi:pimeloyl-ACP methyl ester carboxylesterase